MKSPFSAIPHQEEESGLCVLLQSVVEYGLLAERGPELGRGRAFAEGASCEPAFPAPGGMNITILKGRGGQWGELGGVMEAIKHKVSTIFINT